ncbi:MAG: hypothetical protein R2695_00945 [Acidimicrobiales bacterium]
MRDMASDPVAALLAEGKVLDALDALETVAATVDDPATDRRLVELRHAAFGALPAAPGRESWPPHYADPLPDELGIPTIPAERLSADLIGEP